MFGFMENFRKMEDELITQMLEGMTVILVSVQ